MSFKDFIAQQGRPISIAKQQHILRQGFLDNTLYYLTSGLLKAYYTSIDGKESIKSFIQAGSTIGCLSSTYKELPCSFSLVALEDSELIGIPFEKLLAASNESHAIAKEVIEALVNLSMKKEQREYELLTLSAEERYTKLIKQAPELVTRLTQNDVARYLGITPVALSRIKKRVNE